ncbi:MAG: hypothetical protein DRN81_02335 [Thermoproteota archaeon]|nr:MAG: hypothetical protein DRN81_02335 [Candidatus Korarchaeota archaeon]
MGSNYNSSFSDTNYDIFLQDNIAVGTTAVALTAGGAIDGVQFVKVYNKVPNIIYVGPTGVPDTGAAQGEPLKKRQWTIFAVRGKRVYGICASGDTALACITEVG